MRRLLLLRHAKSERLTLGADDMARKLERRGREDAPRIGAYMARHGLIPDRALVSPSVRTRETWDLIAAAFAKRPPQVFDERLYEAEPETILEVIRECRQAAPTLLVVGHNPGLQDMAKLLIASGDPDARQRLNEKFPTAALAVIEFPFDDWGKLHPHAGRLDHFVSPRSLAAATE
ncbi:MAG TPA: histidine phosphatase family protein [Xanthobacteraceae bacterium]|nr:histidine phosphatase family protein [Xanthobacteraceae bacterium]